MNARWMMSGLVSVMVWTGLGCDSEQFVSAPPAQGVSVLASVEAEVFGDELVQVGRSTEVAPDVNDAQRITEDTRAPDTLRDDQSEPVTVQEAPVIIHIDPAAVWVPLAQEVKDVPEPEATPDVPVDCTAATDIYHGSVSVRSVEELASLGHYAEVTGELMILMPDGETHVSLPCLQRVGERLFIPPCGGNEDVTTISFPRLTHVDGALGAWHLSTLEAFHAPLLETVGGDFWFGNDPSLVSLDLSSLETVGQSIILSDSPLTSLDLPALTSLGWLLDLQNMTLLNDLSVPVLTEAGGLRLYGLDSLETLAISSVEALELLDLRNNPSLATLELPDISELVRLLSLVGNDALEALSMPQLVTVGRVVVTSNGSLSSLDLSSLQTVLKDFEIDDAPDKSPQPLKHLSLSALQTVSGTLRVNGQPALKSLNLSGLQTVGQDLQISQTAELNGFGSPQLQSIGRDMVIDGNLDMTGFCIPQLASIGRHLYLTDGGHGGLSHFALPSLASVGGDLVIEDNDDLPSLPLPALNHVGGDIAVTGNVSLPECTVEMFVSELSEAGDFSGEAFVADNNTTCDCHLNGNPVSGTCTS